jgi:hypothetical protein
MRFAAFCALCLLVAMPARADVENALGAFEDGDYAAARQQAEPLAKAGEASAQFLLGLRSRPHTGTRRLPTRG